MCLERVLLSSVALTSAVCFACRPQLEAILEHSNDVIFRKIFAAHFEGRCARTLVFIKASVLPSCTTPSRLKSTLHMYPQAS